MPSSGPTFWLLNGHSGWKSAIRPTSPTTISVNERTGIRLAADAGGPLTLLNQRDSLGGLVLPRGMALDSTGRLYLLEKDQQRAWVKRLDERTFEFVELPLVDPREQGTRRFGDPIAIAAAGANLYLLDRDTQRVLVFDQETFALRYLWTSSSVEHTFQITESEQKPHSWQPIDITATTSAVYILDQAHGRIYKHTLGTDTLKLCLVCNKVQLLRIATDKEGKIYLLEQPDGGVPRLAIYTGDGKSPETVTDAGSVRDRFAPLPLLVHSEREQALGEVAEGAEEAVSKAGGNIDEGSETEGSRAKQGVAQRAKDQWYFCLPAGLVNNLCFQRSDLVDPVRLANILWLAQDPFTRYVNQRLTRECRDKLQDFIKHGCRIQTDRAQTETAPSSTNGWAEAEEEASDTVTRLTLKQLADLLVKELNRQITSGTLYSPERFGHLALPEAIRKLTQKRLQRQQLIYLNRLLIEQALSQELHPGNLVRYGPQIADPPTGPDRLLRHALATVPPGLVFDAAGNRQLDLDPLQLREAQLYCSSGTWLSRQLDSDIYQCQWHRIELELPDLPASTQVTVYTYTSQRQYCDHEIRQLPDHLWDKAACFLGALRNPAAESVTAASQSYDCLVQSQPGQYLWLRLDLTGDGYETPTVSAARIHYPRHSYLEFLPAVYAEDDESRRFLERFLAVFQTEWDQLDRTIDELYRLFDPRSVPDAFIEYLASWLALPLEGTWSKTQKRDLLTAAPAIARNRGARAGLRSYLQLYLQNITGIPTAEQRDYPVIIEGFRERSFLLLSQGKLAALSHTTALWGPSVVSRLQLDSSARAGEVRLVSTGDPERDLFHVYAHRFRVFLPANWVRSADDEAMVRRALDAEKPAHTDYELCLVSANLRVGVQSTVGLDTIIGPQPMAQLAATQDNGDTEDGNKNAKTRKHGDRLGYDTILSGRPGSRCGIQVTGHLRVGLDTIVS